MARQGLRILPTTSVSSSRTEQRFVTPKTQLEAMKQAFAEYEERQRLMNRIGQDLTSLTDRDTLLQRALSYLRQDLSYDSASLAFVEPGKEIHALQSVNPSGGHQTQIRAPQCGELLGNIIIPCDSRFTAADRETLKTFADFLAVGLCNVKRLEEARTLASTDPLTGIPNRRRLDEVGGQALAGNKSTGLIVFDVDRLKAINDAFGHLAGDAVLKFVAERAKACIRKTDVLIRYGGDEFLILLPETRRPSVLKIAERIRADIQNSGVELGDQIVSTTVSVGFVCLRGELDLSRLVGCADEALFVAKQRGRNLVCDSEENQRSQDRSPPE